MLYTGLTYCGHPLACAAGVAALEAYADDGLIERSRALGRALYTEMQELQGRHAVIGDVRGGHGLFAVVELVRRSRNARAAGAVAADAHGARELVNDAMAAGVSFATRGNLILLAPPLVIEEEELADATLLDRLLADALLRRDEAMSFS